MIQSNLKSRVGVGLAIIILLLSSLVIASGFDEKVCEFGELWSLGSYGVERDDDAENTFDEQVVSRSDDKPRGQSASRQSCSRQSQDDAHGGEWLDSFEDDTRVEWVMSDHLRLEEGDAGIDIKTDLDSNIVAMWHFNQGSGTTAYDSSGYSNDGTIYGASWTTGKYDKALSFDGINDYVSVPNNDSLVFGYNSFSLCSWIKIDSSENSYQEIITKGDVGYNGNPANCYELKLVGINGSAAIAISNESQNYYYITGNQDLRDGQWHFVVGIRNNDTLKIYVDGNLKNTEKDPNIANCNVGGNGPLTFSHVVDYNPAVNIHGVIDDSSVYNRALTAKEIKYIFENGTKSLQTRLANLTTIPITLPPSMHWDTLLINKTEPDKTYINITILNASNNQPIPGSPTYTDNSEVDISYIDPVQYPSIKLNASFEGDGSTTPELHYWAVSWNQSNTWQDTLFGGEKIESSENLVVVDGDVQLEYGGIDSSAIALWNFDESSGTNAHDETDNDNNGTINGATWAFGKYGNALSFDGVNDFVDIPNESNFDLSNSFTLESWIKTSQTGEVGGIITKHYSSDVRGSYCLHLDSDGKIKMILVRSPNNKNVVVADASVNNNKWHHLVGTYDGSFMSIYIDGVLDNSISTSGVPANTNDPVKIGAFTGLTGGTSYWGNFNGLIDDVAIYNRALTPREIKDLFQNGSFRYQSNGKLTSKPITLPTNMCWDTLKINKTVPQDTSLNVTILDGTTNEPIPGYQNLTGTEKDILSINPIVHNSIKLQASFGSNGINTSLLHDWSVNWTENTAPKIIDISSDQIVNRTNSAPLAIKLIDREETEENLTLKIEYKAPSNTNWQTNCVTVPYYASDQWNCTFIPPKDAELGLYSFRVTVNDSFQYLNITIHPELIEVINNKPTAPDVYIFPQEPKTNDNLIVTAENSTDIEMDPKKINPGKYWYRWYRNGSYVEEFENTTFIPHTVTQKDDTWRCVVYPFDGDETGTPVEAEVLIQNSPPLADGSDDEFESHEMFEDTTDVLEYKLMEMFFDRDLDILVYNSSGQKNIDVEIFQNNGSIQLNPVPNWFGFEAITFYANDTSSKPASRKMWVNVKPTNDLPRIVQVGNQLVSDDYSDLGFVVKQDEWFNLTIIVDDVDGDVDRGMIKYFINNTQQDILYLLANENKLVFKPTNEDIGQHYVNLSITDNNETPPQYVYQNIWLEVVNVNDPPGVKILTPTSNKEFSVTDDITFSCEVDDLDLLVPSANEHFTYLWYTNKTELEPLGTEKQIIVTNLTLPPGYYNITVMVKDGSGEPAYASVEIVIKEVSGTAQSTGSSKIATDNYLWLWILISVIIIIISLLIVVTTKNKKRKLEAMGIPKEGEQVLQPDATYAPPPGIATLPSTTEQQPQLIEDGPVSVTPAQNLITPTPTGITTTSLTTPTPQPTAQLPPVGEAELTSEQKIKMLKEQLIRGEISEETYLNLKDELELEAKLYQPGPQLLPPATTTATEPEPLPITQPEMPPETVMPAVEAPVPAMVTEPQPTVELPPDAYVPPEQPQVQEQVPPQEPITETPQPTPQPPTPTLPNSITPLTHQTPTLTVPCPLCNQQIPKKTNPCPHCGG